jgi:iron complex outermembrane receptor protein
MDRASSDLSSVQLGLGQRWATGSLKYTALLGHERTYQAWYGVPEIALTGTPEEITAWAQNSDEYGYGSDTVRIADLIENGRRHNYFRYENEVDEYRQDHHQLHLEQEVGSWRSALTGHYTAGSGYYEQFRSDEDLARRRWLENELSGLAFSLHRSTDQWDLTAGAAGYSYVGDHFGKYIWMGNAGGLQPGHVYYRGVGEKSERNAFVKGAYRLNDRVHLHGEVQGREVIYTASGTDNDGLIIDVKDELTFFNPKVGLNYRCDDRHRVYASVAVANREPSRTDYVDAIDQVVPFPEKLVDYELGYQLTGTELSLEAVLFYMDYTDQLVLTGELNDVNSPLRQNVKDSYRRGIEFSVAWKPEAVRGLAWNGNATWSQNRIENFTETLYNYGDGDYVNLIPLERMDLAMSPSVVAASTLQYVIWDVPGDGPNSRKRVDVEWATKFVGKQFLDNTSSVDRMLDGYVVNDLRLRASCALASGGSLGASIFLNNVLDAMYVSNGWTYSSLYGDISSRVFENYVYPQAGRNTFVSLEYTF